MKKFLSLVLALVMTMSLVTIGAGATDYKDLTDKKEIQYEEAVAVLNKLGIITGYTDGSFQPTGALTRGAAAKIIVSLMQGADFANALSINAAPYKDVPVDSTFAAVISYCKTAGYINGYADGTFRPAAPLTGYAFSKMLLGALGYKGEYEGGFTGSGWTMNVARIGSTAGLFNDFVETFSGNAGVTREQACQLALNTLKATEVQYNGGTNFSSSANNMTNTVTTVPTREYITSNNKDINSNIYGFDGNTGNNSQYLTLQFGEDHFHDLILMDDGSALDDFGRPSNKWSYKKVVIGTFAHTPDFTYTERMTKVEDKDSDATMAKALGLKGYEMAKNVNAVVNGKDDAVISAVGTIATYTDPGTTVEVYLNDKNAAQTITDVVVVQTQLMQVNKVGSDFVSLKLIKDDAQELNKPAIQTVVNDVKDDDDIDVYNTLKGLKADDYVVVTPLYNGSKYDVSDVYAPETVTGKLTKVTTYTKNGNADQIGVTVGGTDYVVAEWNQLFNGLNADTISATKKDVTLVMDSFGNAMYIKDAGASNDYMVVKDMYTSVVNNRIVGMLQGWDISGNAISLNVGTQCTSLTQIYNDLTDTNVVPGDLVGYTTADTKNGADYSITTNGYVHVKDKKGTVAFNTANGDLKASQSFINDAQLTGEANIGGEYYYASDVKFIFVTFDDGAAYGATNAEVDSVYVKTGAQNVDAADLLGAQAYVKFNDNTPNDAQVKAVVIMKEANDAVATSTLYIRDTLGSEGIYTGSGAGADSDIGRKIYGYKADINTPEGVLENQEIYSFDSLRIGDFVKYTARTDIAGFADNFYDANKISNLNNTTSVASGTVTGFRGPNSKLLQLNTVKDANGDPVADVAGSKIQGNAIVDLDTAGARWVDTTGNNISSASDLKDLYDDGASAATLRFVFNNKPTSDYFGKASFIIVTGISGIGGGNNGGSGSGDVVKTYNYTATAMRNGYVRISVTDVVRGAFVPADASVDMTFDVYVDGALAGTETVPVGANAKTATKTSTAYYGVEGTENVTLVSTGMKASKVLVRYQDENGKDITSMLKAGYTTEMTSSTTAAIGFTVNTTSGITSLKYSTAGLTADAPETTFTTSDKTAQSITSKTAKGTDYVTVTIKGLADLVETYSITLPTGGDIKDLEYYGVTAATDKTATVTITAAKASSIAKNENVAISATLSAVPSDNFGYVVEISKLGVKAVVTNGSATVLGDAKITSNVTVGKDDIEVTTIEKLTVEKVTWDAGQATVTFNRAVDKTTAENGITVGTIASSATISATVASGNTVVLTMTGGALAVGDTFTLAATVLDAEYTANKTTADTLTLA